MSYPVREVDQSEDFCGPWKLPTLFWEDKKGQTRFWEIFFDGVNNLGTSYGVWEGKVLSSEFEIVPKAKRNMDQQAFLEAKRKYINKEHEGYSRDLSNSNQQYRKPMLAYKYEPSKIKYWPVLTQPKLDGKRMLAFYDHGQVILKSRTNKPHVSSDYLFPHLKKLFSYLPSQTMIDGEFYDHEVSFQTLISDANQKSTLADRAQHPYHIYDIDYTNEDGTLPPYEDRYRLLVAAYNKLPEKSIDILKIVECEVVCDETILFGMKQRYLDEGYEGIMIRKISHSLPPQARDYDKEYKQTLYVHGRNQGLLKWKDFFDEEATIVEVKNGRGKEKDLATAIIDWKGHRVSVSLNYPEELRREWWNNPQLIIGKPLTIRYQELTTDGLPRFPKGIAIRDYE